MKSTVLALAACGVFAVSLFAAPVARAAVEFSTFGPGNTYDTTEGATTEGSGVGNGYLSFADKFAAGLTGTLTSVDIAFFGINDINVEFSRTIPSPTCR